MDEGLEMFTVYQNTSDFPGWFVVRRSVVTAEGATMDPEPFMLGRSLNDCRGAIMDARPQGLVCMHRAEGDDPVIVETWL